jgi:hypothetical protein
MCFTEMNAMGMAKVGVSLCKWCRYIWPVRVRVQVVVESSVSLPKTSSASSLLKNAASFHTWIPEHLEARDENHQTVHSSPQSATFHRIFHIGKRNQKKQSDIAGLFMGLKSA